MNYIIFINRDDDIILVNNKLILFNNNTIPFSSSPKNIKKSKFKTSVILLRKYVSNNNRDFNYNRVE